MNKQSTTKITKNKAYPKYKFSGVEWLGDVPEHWEVKRARFMLSMNPSKQEINHLDPEAEVAFLPMEAVGENGSLRLDATRPISEVCSGYTFFSEGDVSFAKITPCFENGKGAIMRGLGAGFGFGTTELTVMRPGNHMAAEYLYYLSVSYDFRQNGEAWMYGAGGQKRVPDEFVKEFRIGFPTLLEQNAIAAFLDRETGRIDSLIAKKQRLLELLAEQRTALISHAVTKGLDTKVKMKPSGVEWLGDLPEHWGYLSLKWVSVRYSGGTPDKTVQDYWEDGTIPWLNSGAVNDDYITEPSEYITEEAYRNSSAKWIPKDALVMALAGQGKTKGMVGQLGFRTTCNQSMAAIVPDKRIYPRMLYWWLTKNYINIRNLAGGEARDGLNLEMIGSIPVPLPTPHEQQAIAAFLDSKTAKIDALSDKVKTIIERLKEYRTALISSVVTGKIDVREAI